MLKLKPLWFNTPPATPGGGGSPSAPTPSTPAAPSGAAAPGGGSPPATTAAPASPTADAWFAKVPETWRNDLVGMLPQDAQTTAKNIFDRVPSINVLANNYYEAQLKLRKGLPPEDVPYLPKNATPEQIKEYRSKVDVPDTADKYELSLEQGLVLGEEDRKMFAPVFNILHAAHTPTPVVSALVNEYLKLDQQQVAQVKLQDDRDRQEAQLALKKAWGVDYDRNMGLVEMFFADLPVEVKDAFLGARLGDGKAVFNHPQVLQFFVTKQREVNPLATVVASAGSDGAKQLDIEIAALEAKMGTNEWYQDEKSQARYRELITAREALSAKR